MKHRPVVSVIISAFNAEKYIERSVASALDQTVTDIEVIVVDDASTDGTAAKVRQMADVRVRLFANASNSGPSFSRNYAISEARGDWIAVLDADDWWDPTRLDVLLKYGAHNQAHIVCDDLYLTEDETKPPWTTYLKSREAVIGPVTKTLTVTPLKMIYDDFGVLQPVVRTDFLRDHSIRYKENHRFGEDFVFLLDCLLAGAKMILCPIAYYYYRCGHATLSSSLDNPIGQCNVLEELISSPPYNQLPQIRKSLRQRLNKKRLIVEEARAKRLFSERQFLKGIATVMQHPMLLIEYARIVRRGIANSQ